ncbi:amino acid ABC transporter permease [Methanofollis aquaemaris]|uniref:Amino acid ABC transporter permease n=1 Tax=Methanofollis aquaemaris TaxID=126734 RepID=A0A8A3S6L4_9EURY|nr:amino acid ABC transporter permease [Methanofollis aquaemaris]QSZ67778.1 amino acid ABC transporter permease [Methanofollis aquaemaris]
MTGVLEVIAQSLPYLLEGIVVTLALVLAALGVGLLMGVPMAVAHVYGSRAVKGLISIYVWFFRALPNLVLLFLFFFGIFPLIGLGEISPFVVAVVVLGLRSGAYQSQIFRGAIQSLGEGQMTAARSLGMSRRQAIKSIILPQAMRIALPGWSNEYPILLTDSAVCYAIGVMEILFRADQIVSVTYEPMTVYVGAAVVYILLNYGGMWLLDRVEKKITIPGFGKGA